MLLMSTHNICFHGELEMLLKSSVYSVHFYVFVEKKKTT